MITNAEFLKAIFPPLGQNEYLWSTSFVPSPLGADPSCWKGHPVHNPADLGDFPHGNGYYSVAVLKSDGTSGYRRIKANFSYIPIIVADDVEGEVECTYRLQTSEGKCQVCWKLDEAITDIGVAERMHKALADMDYMPADKSGNNVVRYVRLPVQINTKYNPAFPGKLDAWHPERVFTLEQLCDILGIQYEYILKGHGQTPSKTHQNDAGERIDDSEHIRRICCAEALHESLNILAARYVSRGMSEGDVIDTITGMMRAHDDGTERYAARIGEVPRSVRGAVEKFSPKIEATDWDIQPVDVFVAQPVPAFPIEVLPPAMGKYAELQAESTGFDVGAFAFMTLFGMIAIIDKRAKIKASATWEQPSILWVALADSSGGGKSYVVSTGSKFLRKANEQLIANSMSEFDAYKRAYTSLKKGETLLQEKPDWHQIVVEDTTVEALADVLKTNPRGVTLVADEMTAFIGGLDAYNNGVDRDRSIYLSAYDGGYKLINRKSSGNTIVPNMAVSILTGVQPEKLAEMYKNSKSGGADGLYQRFLTYCMQPSQPMRLNVDVPAETIRQVSQIAEQIDLWSNTGAFLHDTPSLSSEAAAEVEKYCNDISGIAKRTENARFREHLFKFKGFVLRIALGLHIIDAAASGRRFSGIVGVDTINKAQRVLACLYRHSESIYGLLDADTGAAANTRLVAEAILTQKMETFSYGVLSEHVLAWRDWKEMQRNAVLDRLIEFGWIRDITPVPVAGKRGRRPLGVFSVNPLVHTAFLETSRRLRSKRTERHEMLTRSIKEYKERDIN